MKRFSYCLLALLLTAAVLLTGCNPKDDTGVTTTTGGDTVATTTAADGTGDATTDGNATGSTVDGATTTKDGNTAGTNNGNHNNTTAPSKDSATTSKPSSATTTKTDTAASYDKPASGVNTAALLFPMTSNYDAQANAMRKKIWNATSTPTVSGTTWYISENGNDSADGKSKNTAWKTVKGMTANVSKIKSGDAVLFERGGVYRGTFKAISGVYYGAYGSGDKPCIYGSSQNWAKATWKQDSKKNVWYTTGFTSDAGIVVFNHGEGVGIRSFQKGRLSKNTQYYYDTSAKTLYLYCNKGNPSTVYKSIEIGEKDNLIRLDNCTNTTIDNLCLKYTGVHGIGGCNNKNITIKNCEIGWIGGSLQNELKQVRLGNAIEFWNKCDNITVDNCWIYQCYDTGFTAQGSGNEDGSQTNIKLTNTLLEYNWYSTEMWNSCTINNTMDNIEFSGNIMRFSGYGWSNYGGQRPDADEANSSHLFNGAQMTNFKATNNIFDKGMHHLINGAVKGFNGNTYAQEKTTRVGSLGLYSNGYLAFDDSVEANLKQYVDPNPTVHYYTD